MTNDEYRKIILTRIYEVLKPKGFKKKGNNFFKLENDVYLIVQLQSSISSAQNNLKLTVNLGIFSTLIEQSFSALNNPSLVNSHWRKRIGFLDEKKFDKWWTITNSGEAEIAGQEITKILQEKGLLVLSELNSTDKLISLWKKGESVGITDKQRQNFLEILRKNL